VGAKESLSINSGALLQAVPIATLNCDCDSPCWRLTWGRSCSSSRQNEKRSKVVALVREVVVHMLGNGRRTEGWRRFRKSMRLAVGFHAPVSHCKAFRKEGSGGHRMVQRTLGNGWEGASWSRRDQKPGLSGEEKMKVEIQAVAGRA